MFLIFQVLFYLKLERKKSFKHKQDEIVNEQSFIAGLRENAIARNVTQGIYIINCIYFFIVCWKRYIMFTLIKI